MFHLFRTSIYAPHRLARFPGVVADRFYAGWMEDPTTRRRLSADDALQQKRDVVRLHLAGETMRSIAAATGMGLTSVHRTIAAYKAAVDRADADDPDFDEEIDPELGALAARLTPSLSCEDVRTREQFDALNELERFRFGHLPADHPARVALPSAWTQSAKTSAF